MKNCAFFIAFFLGVEKVMDSNADNITGAPNIVELITKQYSQNITTKHLQDSFLGANMPMVQRAFYVLIGVSLLAVLYFVIRTVRLKKKPLRKKYGLLSDYDDNMEMGSLESDEEKIFEARSLRR
ncbi:hypothetical protein GDO86_000997 [Hymenochirus boettgeri]|uniref:Uncharacterized protein n=1 Tax=Hymenochirus boettgeri TaxID=247094 RepID=A0A8T2KGB8_9PIPI|nr:hypothetical protein GDO86_000997 [Hymenochirus boettgeri]